MSPSLPLRPCTQPGCLSLVSARTPCPVHGKRPWEAGRESAAARGYGADWRKLRAHVLARDPVCTICQINVATKVDHVMAKHLGGTDDETNLRGVCTDCHRNKSSSEGGRARGSRSWKTF